MAWVFHSGSGGWKEITWAFNTPRGAVTITASPRKILAHPVCVERACTSTPVLCICVCMGWGGGGGGGGGGGRTMCELGVCVVLSLCASISGSYSAYHLCCSVQQWPPCSAAHQVPWTGPQVAGHTRHAGPGGTLECESNIYPCVCKGVGVSVYVGEEGSYSKMTVLHVWQHISTCKF